MLYEMLVLAMTLLGIGVMVALIIYPEYDQFPALTKFSSVCIRCSLIYIVAVFVLLAWGVTP